MRRRGDRIRRRRSNEKKKLDEEKRSERISSEQILVKPIKKIK